MEFMELIESRRSIRAYDPEKKVTKEEINEMINAAIQAPSWKNSQTARYYAIMDPEVRAKFAAEALPAFNANSSANATLVVTTFVANRAGFDRDGNPDNEAGNGWGFYDLGLHNMNFVLKAKELGLDTLIMGIRDADKVREILNIPETEIIVAVIAVGHAAKGAVKPARKATEDVVKFI